MLRGDLELLVSHAAAIRSPDAREAFAYLVGHAALLPDWRCEARQKGVIADFRWYDAAGEQPYALIPNADWLLLYVRRPAVRTGAGTIATLRGHFEDVRENPAGELTVRIRTLQEAQALVAMLFGAPLSAEA